ncbi:unnamed protein product [Dicrocoelium dendriticum]|nr:unnamed protein product [Dicrocoelium dendriticum]
MGVGFRPRGSGGFRGRRGGSSFHQENQGPPEEVVEAGTFLHPCQEDIICRLTSEKIPYFNAPVYLHNKEEIGRVDEIFGPIRDAFYIDPYKFLSLDRVLNPASNRGRGGGRGRGGDSRGGRGLSRGGRGSFRGDFRGGRGGARGDFRGGRGDHRGGRGEHRGGNRGEYRGGRGEHRGGGRGDSRGGWGDSRGGRGGRGRGDFRGGRGDFRGRGASNSFVAKRESGDSLGSGEAKKMRFDE